MHTRRIFALFAGAALLAACGGDGAGSADASPGAAPSSGSRAAARGTPASEADLPVHKPTGPIDEELAERGEKLFSSKGCVACHTIGQGKRVGPDLQGITEKVTFPWIFHWVSDPDSMLRSDTTAQRLLKEYLVPMPNQNVSPEEFLALYEYLRAQGPADSAGGAPGASSASGSGAGMGGMMDRGRMGGMHERMHDTLNDTTNPAGGGSSRPGNTPHDRRN